MSESTMKISIADAQTWARKHIHPHEARLLLRHVCDYCIAHLIARDMDILMDDQWQLFQRLVNRRAAGEPIAYLTGRREFYGRKFLVNPSVLIPRPETELLIELALAYFAAIPQPKVLDLGTGSGVLAITLALELDRPEVVGVDSSRDAISIAISNALTMQTPNLTLVWINWYTGLNPADRFHLIVANPPYVAEAIPISFRVICASSRPPRWFRGTTGYAISRPSLRARDVVWNEGGGYSWNMATTSPPPCAAFWPTPVLPKSPPGRTSPGPSAFPVESGWVEPGSTVRGALFFPLFFFYPDVMRHGVFQGEFHVIAEHDRHRVLLKDGDRLIGG